MKPKKVEPTIPRFDKDPQQEPALEQASSESDHRPRRRSNLNFRDVDGETVILNRQAEFVHQLNPTASLIWAHCDGTSTMGDIADQLVAAYEIDPRTALDDVKTILAEFRKLGLLETSS